MRRVGGGAAVGAAVAGRLYAAPYEVVGLGVSSTKATCLTCLTTDVYFKVRKWTNFTATSEHAARVDPVDWIVTRSSVLQRLPLVARPKRPAMWIVHLFTLVFRFSTSMNTLSVYFLCWAQSILINVLTVYSVLLCVWRVRGTITIASNVYTVNMTK